MTQPRPHKLELYRLAVQHPEADVAFVLRAHAHYQRGPGAHRATTAARKRCGPPTRLRDDFAGTAAIAMTWLRLSDNHRALAVDRDPVVCRWIRREALRQPGHRADDFHLLCADVAECRPPLAPKVDIITALNFAVCEYHERARLLQYFRAARRSLAPGGIMVVDLFGGPGAMRPGMQRREMASELGTIEYQWEQRGWDAVTGKVDCRIHFKLADGRLFRNAFRYDWRLWTPAELCETMRQAGFAGADVWCDRYDPRLNRTDGVFRVMRTMPPRCDWVVYIVGSRDDGRGRRHDR